MLKKLMFGIVPVALALTLALGGCGKSASDGGPGANNGGGSGGGSCKTSQTIELGVTTFVDSCVNVSVNQPVTFDDPTSSGGVHIICTGTNGACAANASAPKDLGSPGFQIQPGQQHQVTFTAPGTYQIACTVHPQMNLTITVK